MKRIPITSSNISTVGYDEDTGRMEVTFSNGKPYTYHGVTKKQYNEMLCSPSVGGYLNREIKPNCRCESGGCE